MVGITKLMVCNNKVIIIMIHYSDMHIIHLNFQKINGAVNFVTLTDFLQNLVLIGMWKHHAHITPIGGHCTVTICWWTTLSIGQSRPHSMMKSVRHGGGQATRRGGTRIWFGQGKLPEPWNPYPFLRVIFAQKGTQILRIFLEIGLFFKLFGCWK